MMEKTLSEEEKQRINALLEKHQPREETREEEMVVLSEKGRKISIKTEVASSSMEPFEKQPVEHEEEVCNNVCCVSNVSLTLIISIETY